MATVNVTYDGETIANFDSGKKTLKCSGKQMTSDVVITGECRVEYNNRVIAEIENGQTKTLKCANKKMLSDLNIYLVGFYDETAGIYDENDVMLASWNELVNDYGLDVEKDYNDNYGEENDYSSTPSSMYYIIGNNSEFSNTKKIIIPNTITYLGEYSLTHLGVENIVLPNNITRITSYMLWSCGSLKSIEIPNSVTSIDDHAFGYCKSLETVAIPNSVTTIEDSAFVNCISLTSIEIPNSVTSIGRDAFTSCGSLKSIEIPNSVTSIGYNAFDDCTGLTSIEIPNSVTNIGSSAFINCTSLERITIPNSVTNIGMWAFYGCPSLTIYCEATRKPSGWNTYWNPDNRPVVWGYEIN